MAQYSIIPVTDYAEYIADRTHDFTGRAWVFAAIDTWLADPKGPPFFIITGEPGIGKTAIAARLTQVRDPAAYHFCVARQIDSVDPLTFVRSMSIQLAAHCQPFAQALAQVGHSQINVKVEQTVQQVATGGSVTGVVIQNLVLSAIGSQELFIQTVLTPLKVVAGGLERPLIILVDALDEAVQYKGAETIVDLLTNAVALPQHVQFVLSSRPEGRALRYFQERHIPYLSLDAGKGNFLYLVWLLPSIATSSGSCPPLRGRWAGLRLPPLHTWKSRIRGMRSGFYRAGKHLCRDYGRASTYTL